MGRMKGNIMNNCGFLKCIIPVTGGHCYCSSRASKDLATPLGHLYIAQPPLIGEFGGGNG